MKLRLSRSLYVLLFAVSACQTTGTGQNVQPNILTHMLRLQCVNSDLKGLQSRIAVLDIEHSFYDFALAAGHALPRDRPCEALDFNGLKSSVEAIKFSKNYKPGTQSDWAIIKFPKIETRNLVRYRLESIDESEDLEGTVVQFAQARGLPENAQTCRLSILDFSSTYRRVTHDCRSIAGQSGSPVTRTVKGESQLIGLSIGQLWMLDSPKTGRPDRAGYINLLDDKTVTEIEVLIDQIR